MPAGDAIVGRDGDHAALGEVLAVLLELLRRAVGPAAAEEEDDGGALVAGLVPRGIEDVEVELRVADGFVGFDFGAVELRGVGAGGFLFGFFLGECRQGGEAD